MKRRDFLAAVVAAPFVVTSSGVLMPVRKIWTSRPNPLLSALGIISHDSDIWIITPRDPYKTAWVNSKGLVQMADSNGRPVGGSYLLSIIAPDGSSRARVHGTYIPSKAT